MGIENDFQKKKEYSMWEKKHLENSNTYKARINRKIVDFFT